VPWRIAQAVLYYFNIQFSTFLSVHRAKSLIRHLREAKKFEFARNFFTLPRRARKCALMYTNEKWILSDSSFFNKTFSILAAIILSRAGIARLRFFPGRTMRDSYPSCFEIIVARGGAYSEGAASSNRYDNPRLRLVRRNRPITPHDVPFITRYHKHSTAHDDNSLPRNRHIWCARRYESISLTPFSR